MKKPIGTITVSENDDGSHDVVVSDFCIDGGKTGFLVDAKMDTNGKLEELKLSKAPFGAGFVYNGGAKK